MWVLFICYYVNGNQYQVDKTEKFQFGNLDSACKFLVCFDQSLPVAANVVSAEIRYIEEKD